MLRCAVQRRPYDWEPLLAPVLQSNRSSVSEATGFTPHRLAFGREMRLPVDLGSPLPEPPRDVRTFAAEVAEDLEWSYKVAREIIGHGHKRAESRYNERVVEHAYQPGCLVRVVVCRAVRRGLNRTAAPRPCSCVDSQSFLLPARQPRSKSCSSVARDSLNTTRSVALRSHFVNSPPRLWEVESVAGTSWYSPRYLAAGHFTSYSKLSRRYIFYY